MQSHHEVDHYPDQEDDDYQLAESLLITHYI